MKRRALTPSEIVNLGIEARFGGAGIGSPDQAATLGGKRIEDNTYVTCEARAVQGQNMDSSDCPPCKEHLWSSILLGPRLGMVAGSIDSRQKK